MNQNSNKKPMPLGGVLKIGNTQSKPESTAKISYGSDLRDGKKGK